MDHPRKAARPAGPPAHSGKHREAEGSQPSMMRHPRERAAMWIVLLDRSGSMDGGFHGSTGFRGRTSTTTAEQKLEAAKQALRERLAGIDRTTVAIFAFDHGTELIYDGPSDEAARIDSALARIVPGAETNVAAALDAARGHAIRTQAAFPLVVLVVTDGLDDPERARASAGELAKHGAIINVLLIDPTPEGE